MTRLLQWYCIECGWGSEIWADQPDTEQYIGANSVMHMIAIKHSYEGASHTCRRGVVKP